MTKSKLLPPGTYRLTADVPNPKPNRRRRDWTGAAVFKKGWVFSLDDRDGRANEDDPAELRKQGSNDMVFQGSKTFAVIAKHLEAVVEKPSDVLQRFGWSLMGGNILNELQRTHVLTTAQVEKAARMALAIGRIDYLCESFESHILGRGMDEHNAYRVVFGRSLDASKVVLWVNVHPDVGTYRIVQQGMAVATAEEPEIHAASVQFLEQLTAKGYRKVP